MMKRMTILWLLLSMVLMYNVGMAEEKKAAEASVIVQTVAQDWNTILKGAMVELIGYVKQGGSFVEKQAPLVAQEYLRYNLWIDVAWISIWGLVLIPIALSIKPFHRTVVKDTLSEGEEFFITVWGISMIAGSVTALVGLSILVPDLIKVLVAPRLYVLEGLKQLIL
jgi:hypothetical protein